jgi:hypothetical protein
MVETEKMDIRVMTENKVFLEETVWMGCQEEMEWMGKMVNKDLLDRQDRMQLLLLFSCGVIPASLKQAHHLNFKKYLSNKLSSVLVQIGFLLVVLDGSEQNFDHTRAAAALMLDDVQIPGSGSSAQAPDTIHQYSISNTILVYYTANQQLSLQWTAAYYSGGGTRQSSTSGLSVGPNQANFVSSTFNPVSGSSTYEATASLVITRIVNA